VPRFDAYSATCRGVKPLEAVNLLTRSWDEGDQVQRGRGFHGFGDRWGLRGRDGAEWGAVSYGGTHGDLCMVEVKGERTPSVVADVRKVIPDHRCTRVDSCEDHDCPGAWDRFLEDVLAVKAGFRLRGEKRGDWDYPEDGRTMYLGATRSAVRARIYEKGKQREYSYLGRPHWVRSEVQVRPEGAQRRAFAVADATEVWGASPFTRELAARILGSDVPALAAYEARRQNERDVALRYMCIQYGPHMKSLADDLGGGECLGLTLLEMIDEVARSRGGVR
jgi:hypothetical protein